MTRTLHGMDDSMKNHMRNLHNGSLLRMFGSNDPYKQHVALVACRRMLTLHTHLSRDVVEAGILPSLVRLLGAPDPDMQHEAAWALCNIAAGTPQDTADVLHSGALPPLLMLLRLPTTTSSYKLNLVAAQAIGNIAHEARDVVLQHSALPRIVAVLLHCIADTKTAPIIGEMIRVLSSTLCKLCQGTPRPALNLVFRALPVLVLLIHAVDDVIIQNACWALESFFAPLRGEIDTPQSLFAALKAGALSSRLLELCTHPNQNISVPALRALLYVSVESPDDFIAVDALPTLHAALAAPFPSRILALRILSSACAHSVQLVLDAGLIRVLFQMTLTNVDPRVCFFVAEVIHDAANNADGLQTHTLVNAGCLEALVCLLHYCTFPRFQARAPYIVHFCLSALEIVLRHGQPLPDGDLDNPFAQELLRLDACQYIEWYQHDQPQHITDRATLIFSLYLHPLSQHVPVPHEVHEAVVDAAAECLL